MADVIYTAIVTDPIQTEKLYHKVARVTAGAIVSFCGIVREIDHHRLVASLEYEAHPTASLVLSQIATSIAQQCDTDCAIAIEHRIGMLSLTDIAVAIYISTPHRGEAFAACQQAIDSIKQQLPIWKKQYFQDGTSEWVNCS